MREVRLICGKLQGNNVLRFWKVGDGNIDPDIGNYAIVENQDSYALIEILGLVITTEEQVIKISTTDYSRMKRMLKEINIKDLLEKEGK